MKTLMDFGLKEAYKRVAQLGDRLAEIESLMDWEAFRPIVGDMYDNKSEQGGRPNIDEVVMIKLLVLQQWYGLSDPELERQTADRLSFTEFFGFPEDIPDFTTVWYFRERLAKTGKDWQLGGIKLDFGTHLVLTVDPKRSHNIVECVKGLRAEWNDLRRWLQRYFGVKTISYIEVLEFGKKQDLPHLHILMARVFFEKEDLKAIYKWRGEQRIRVTRIRDFNALGYVLKYATKVFNDFDVVKDSRAYLYWVTDAKVYGMSRDHYKSIHRREVAMVAFGWFMQMAEGEEYECFEYVGIFDWYVLDPPPPVVTDEWVDLHLG